MSKVVVALFAGLSLGGVYALIAMGLVLAYRATDVFNFAHGELMLLGAYLAGRWQQEAQWPFGIIVVAALFTVGLLSAAFYRLVLQRTVGLPLFIQVIATLGFAAILDGLMVIEFGSNEYNLEVPGLPSGVVEIFGARINKTSLLITVFSIGLALLLTYVVRGTELGTRVRAAGQDAILASQGGIRVNRIYVGSWFVAGALAAVAGVAYGATNVVNSSIVGLGLLALPAMILGGLDSVEGALVGGIAVGLLQSFVTAYFGGGAIDAITYALLLIVLLFMPHGLFGTRQVRRV